MFLAYFDESGDDGYPNYSSDFFILTSIYLHYSNWQRCFSEIHQFRRVLRERYRFPIKQEFHTREFVTDKNPYHGKFSPVVRRKVLFEYCQFIASLDVRAIIVVIDKTKIRRPNYQVLKNALTYNVQRIENDLALLGEAAKFMIISDEGRTGAMRNVTRKLQRINYIPSKFGPTPYRKEIRLLLEDPLPKNSEQSYFIQIADTISFVTSLYVRQNLRPVVTPWGRRILQVLQPGDEIQLLQHLKPVLNLQASRNNEFGIVCYPK